MVIYCSLTFSFFFFFILLSINISLVVLLDEFIYKIILLKSLEVKKLGNVM